MPAKYRSRALFGDQHVTCRDCVLHVARLATHSWANEPQPAENCPQLEDPPANQNGGLTVRYVIGGDAPDFVEVGEAGIAMDDAMRRERRVQLVG